MEEGINKNQTQAKRSQLNELPKYIKEESGNPSLWV